MGPMEEEEEKKMEQKLVEIRDKNKEKERLL